MRSIPVILAATLFSATAAHASSVAPPLFSETVSYTAVDSYNALGDAGNTVLTANVVGGFDCAEIIVAGTLTEVDTGTYAREAHIAITAPNGSADATATSVGSYTGTASFGPLSNAVDPAFDPAGTVTFEFYESFDDDVAGVDQTWDTVDITFTSGSSVVDGGFDLGALPTDGTLVELDGTQVSGGLDYYTFTVDAVGASGTWFDALTGTTGVDDVDTELAIYDAAGNLVATDDDGGVGLYSNVSIGSDDPYTVDVDPGFHGYSLPAGAYTLVVGSYDTDFTPLIGDIEAGTTRVGAYHLSVGADTECNDADLDGLCDPLLHVDNLVGGETAMLTLSGGRPGSDATFVVSPSTPGTDTFCSPVFGVCIDLESPRIVLGSMMVDAAGSAMWETNVPAGRVGSTVYFQAVWTDTSASEGANTEVVTATVQ